MSNPDLLILYEHPLNERTRSLLRLEHLFDQTHYHLPLPEVWNSRAAIDGLLGVINIFQRSDLKGDLIKEVDRYRKALHRIGETQVVDEGRLEEILDTLDLVYSKLQSRNGSPGQQLRRNTFLMDILQRSTIPGGNCAFDLPQYHYWLQQPSELRVEQLQQWMATFEEYHDAVSIILTLIRDSSDRVAEEANDGIFQQNLDPQQPTQLIRLFLRPDLGCFPEISGGRHRFTIRFLAANETGRPAQLRQLIPFNLATCVF